MILVIKKGKIRRGNYIFIWWIGDHGNHVHIYRNGKLIGKWNLDAWSEEPGSPKISAKIRKILRELRMEGKL